MAGTANLDGSPNLLDFGQDGTAVFSVIVAGRVAFAAGGSAAVPVLVDLVGEQRLRLVWEGADDGSYADWADARLTLIRVRPVPEP